MTTAAPERGETGKEVLPDIVEAWEKGIRDTAEAQALVFSNRLVEADEKWAEMMKEMESREVNFEGGQHDVRGIILFSQATFALFTGLICLKGDQLDEALEKFQAAEKLVAADHDWVGKNVFEGFCLLAVGGVQFCQLKLARGAWNILNSWRYLRKIEAEGLDYQGYERNLIRSMSLYALGTYHLLTSMMPPRLLSAAQWLTGFTGSRETALSQLLTCWEEDGMEAPFAGLSYVGFVCDTSDFIGEFPALRKERAKHARRILDWAENKYQNSAFWMGNEANYRGSVRDIDGAIEVTKATIPNVENLPYLLLMARIGVGKYYLAKLDWVAAAEETRAAADVHRAVKRRALCPSLFYTEYLCYRRAGIADKASEALNLCLSFKKEKKKWNSLDADALANADKALKLTGGGGKAEGVWLDMHLFQQIIFVHRLAYRMPDAQLVAFIAEVQNELAMCGEDAEQQCMGLAIQAEASRQAERFDEAQRYAEECLALEPKLSKEAIKGSALHYGRYVSAYAHTMKGNVAAAQEALTRLDALPDHSYRWEIEIKANHLRQHIGMELQDSYMVVKVAASRASKVVVDVPEDAGRVEWDWVIEAHTVDFVASFVPAGSAEPVELQRIEKHGCEMGPAEGSFEATGPGTLTLAFDNSFSYLRSKMVKCRVQPKGLQVTHEQ